MKLILGILITLASLNALAGVNHGQEITGISGQDTHGGGISFFHDDQGYGWNLRFNVLLGTIAPSYQISSMYWRAFDTSSNSYLCHWQAMPQHPTCTAGCTFNVSVEAKAKPDVELLVSKMKHLLIEFSVNDAQMKPTHYFSVENLCRTKPTAIVDLTTLETGCP